MINSCKSSSPGALLNPHSGRAVIKRTCVRCKRWQRSLILCPEASIYMNTHLHADAGLRHASGMALWMAMLISPPLGSKLKYLNNYEMDCHYILCRRSWSSEDESSEIWWSPDFFSSAIIRSKFQLVQYFGFWANTCKTTDAPISLSSLCLEVISKCLHANTLN